MKALSPFFIFASLVLFTEPFLLSEPSCPPAQYIQFVQKNEQTPQPIIPDPYKNPSTEYMQKVNENLNNKNRVCALQYQDPSKKTYILKEFPTRADAEQ